VRVEKKEIVPTRGGNRKVPREEWEPLAKKDDIILNLKIRNQQLIEDQKCNIQEENKLEALNVLEAIGRKAMQAVYEFDGEEAKSCLKLHRQLDLLRSFILK
jgi:hypothetical protein